MVQLHGGVPLGGQVQVLLGQVGPQLPDLKLGDTGVTRGLGGPPETTVLLLLFRTVLVGYDLIVLMLFSKTPKMKMK